MSKVTALDVANLFVNLSSYDVDNDMTNMKVNKLIYFAQGWSLVFFGAPLFDDSIEAWEHGPVVDGVYKAFKSCGKNTIEKPCSYFNENVFSSEQIDLLIDVYREYNKYSASELRNITHMKGTPWSMVYIPKENRVISVDDMKKYFHTLKKISRFDMKKATANIPVVGWYDENGHLVLPKEMDDGNYEL